ncbi:GLPGLI family protein [Mucilaginibacter sp. HD30]
MKPFLTIYCALMLTMSAYAQQSYPTLIKVQYNFIHIKDTTQRDKPYTEVMLLVAGKDASYYTSFNRLEQQVDLNFKIMEDRKNGVRNSSYSYSKSSSYGHYYVFPKQHKFISYEQMHVNYLVEGDIEQLNWKILKDTLSFSGIHAQKATATFKGRNWIAWFAPDLPFTYGPWQLSGLPGLIVEAYDDKKEVQFKFAGIEKVKPGDLAIDKARDFSANDIKNIVGLNVSEITVLPERPINYGGPIKITKSEYNKLKAEQEKDPIGFMTAQFAAIGIKDPAAMAQSVASGGSSGGGGAKGSNATIQVPTNEKRPTPVKNAVNNPIELNPKK